MVTINKQTYATLALVAAGVLGGLVPIAVKIVLREISPLTYLFLRLSIMILILIPLAWNSMPTIRQYWKHIIILGVFWISNFLLFIFGVKSTTALASQLLTSGVPIYVLLENSFVNKEKLSIWQIFGIIIGLVGSFFLISKGNSIQSGYGTINGNLLIFLSAICSSLYLIGTKKFIHGHSPVALTASTAVVGWVITGILMLSFEGLNGFTILPTVTTEAWLALLFMGIITGVVMWFLINFGLKFGSAIVAGGMTYINILTAGIFGVIILGESITNRSVVGGTLLLLGIFLSIFTPLFTRNKIRKS
ncbi:MAG: DMT family transporter [Patescibacteria group bacterium]